MSELQPQSQAMQSVAQLLTSKAMIAQLKLALPKHVTPERLARIVLTEIRRTPKLLECNRESLLGAILQAAQLGLEPGVLGQSWIIPYGREATFIPGYRGLAQLAWRSAQIASITARAVFDGDTFSFDFGEDVISHKPSGETDPAKLTHAYAIIRTTSGGKLWDVMTRGEIERIRSRSRAGTSGPWKTDYAEMAKKTVLRRLFKIAPCSAELQTAMALDDAADAGLPQGLDFTVPQEPEREVNPKGEESSDTIDADGLEKINDAAKARGTELGDSNLAARILADVAAGRRVTEMPKSDLDAFLGKVAKWEPPAAGSAKEAVVTDPQGEAVKAAHGSAA